MLLLRWVYPTKSTPQKIKIWEYILKSGGWNFGISGLNGVAMARHGLILWENDATGPKIIF